MKNRTLKNTLLGSHNYDYDFSHLFKENIEPYFKSKHGILFDADCIKILPQLQNDCVDTIFADPPFNLNKEYGKKSKDNLKNEEYVSWCYMWLDQCIRTLKPGGSLFLYNLPKWNLILGAYLMTKGLEFRHSIAIEMNNCLPITGRLYPSHYSMLYFSKGKPNTFRKIRTPIEVCRHCDGDIKDYGGHRKSMNPNGVNLKDVWVDIPPVRHAKFKSANRKANALSTKLLDRVIEISTNPGDIVLDPFGGSGTTYAVCEKKNRKWIGIELDFAPQIAERLQNPSIIKHHKNDDYIEV